MADRVKAKHVMEDVEGMLGSIARMPAQTLAGEASARTIAEFNARLATAREAAPDAPDYRWPAPLDDGSTYVDVTSGLTRLKNMLRDAAGVPTVSYGRVTR